jgi:hypothetical protein
LVEFPGGYSMTKHGLVWRKSVDEDVLVAGPFEVLAETRDGDGTSWGLLLLWSDNDGRAHQLALPALPRRWC